MQLRLRRFSLRTLIAALTLACLWLAFQARQAHERRMAVQWVLARGGSVQYDWQLDRDFRYQTFARPLAPRWMRALLGNDFFQHVRLVDAAGAHLSDLSPITPLKSLECLILTGNEIDDLTPLAEFAELRVLLLDNNRVHNVQPLAKLANLRLLSLAANEIEDVSPLRSLPRLEELNLSRNRIPDVAPLARLASLRILDASGNRVSRCRSLAQLRALRWLDLRDNRLAAGEEAWLRGVLEATIK